MSNKRISIPSYSFPTKFNSFLPNQTFCEMSTWRVFFLISFIYLVLLLFPTFLDFFLLLLLICLSYSIFFCAALFIFNFSWSGFVSWAKDCVIGLYFGFCVVFIGLELIFVWWNFLDKITGFVICSLVGIWCNLYYLIFLNKAICSITIFFSLKAPHMFSFLFYDVVSKNIK